MEQGPIPVWVNAGEHGWINLADAKFLDVEEGLHGDEYTFEYKGEEYRSVAVTGSRPGG